ncbi:hypothetical protein [Streptomyces sp. TLI_171]|uniref:hypothetical protein n=1 Tax=Streptomyces sp. TLI_171 TaxID=1938859 RepID=UPI000C19639B|nr:hypothetical protein [Streptomyces sp. TLI_171]RKE03010.1 hypothetical protein BX266_7617 [Streptomyces sp. TLI_171]
MSTERGSALTIARTRALRSPLPACEAALPADQLWLRARAQQFARAAGLRFLLVLDSAKYTRLSGQRVGAEVVGRAYRGPESTRLPVPLLYLQQDALATRAEADQVLAHEVTHLKWPSYGHKVAAFDRAQWLLDHLEPSLAG